MTYLDLNKIKEIFELAVKEDIGDGDITTSAIFRDFKNVRADLLCKENGIIAGLEVIKLITENFLNNVEFFSFYSDGYEIHSGDFIGTFNGDVREILKYERILLNILQRMSGVATLTNKFVNQVKGTKAKILDTRKTIPGWRYLDKLAVKIGGGENHRFGLYDMFLIKDNHIFAAGGITQAINLCKDYNKIHKSNFKIEVEVKNLLELKEAIENGVDRVMLDNFSIDSIKDAVKLVNGKVEIEVSGGVTLDTIREIAECGVDYISVGAITHSARALDISLEIIE
ncbi:MAG: carboxylating nicotinate-nucleotide diphosphorylase [Ignavibacteria bacterium]|jgi:nicotinate-nucleotide pyrophosphorylase (carboxylating)|nr:carboxylating nicotinate-nucleotide diphosphorylase [Ignavibacteria bacterium]MDH7527410.1 carboxylating nicotinate-nucleotide diphosphorylase [Ignavibacteria bacterium]